jgi:type IV secretory pathway TraG/TraD family ATPase VirD4
VRCGARELITPDEVMQLENEEVIVFAGKKVPADRAVLSWTWCLCSRVSPSC